MISQEALMRKIKEEVAHAEEHMHTDEFSVYIGKLHVLCEVLLDQSTNDKPNQHAHTNEVFSSQKRPTHNEDANPELLEGDSIFDF